MNRQLGYGCLRLRHGRRRTVDLHGGILDNFDIKQEENCSIELDVLSDRTNTRCMFCRKYALPCVPNRW